MQVSPSDRKEMLTPDALIAIVCRDLENDRDAGSLAPVDDEELERVATESVRALWDRSRIKTFLPVLAARTAREQLRQSVSSHSIKSGSRSPAPISYKALTEELGGDIDLHLTYSRDEEWQAVLVNHHRNEIPTTVRVAAKGETVDDALSAVVAKAKDVLST